MHASLNYISHSYYKNKVSNTMKFSSCSKERRIMGIDLATWRARIGLNYYHACRPLQTRWRSSCGQLRWGVGEVMNDTPLVLKGCMAVIALSLILQYITHTWPKLKGRGGGGKLRCHWSGTTISQVRETVCGGGTLLLKDFVVVIPLLLIMAGDVELNPGPPKMQGSTCTAKTLNLFMSFMHFTCNSCSHA